MKTVASAVVAILLTLMSTSCVSKPQEVAFEITPVWIAVLFGDEGEAAPLVDADTQRLLVASAVFIDSRKSAFTSLDELNGFVVERFGAEAAVPGSVLRANASSGQFVLTFRSGEPVVMTVTATGICLAVKDAKDRDAILRAFLKHSGGSPTVPRQESSLKASDFSLTEALLHVLK